MAGRWSGFVGEGERAKALHEIGNPDHRVRVEHDRDVVLVHLSEEDGRGWTTLAVDRRTRQFAVSQDRTQATATRNAYGALVRLRDRPDVPDSPT